MACESIPESATGSVIELKQKAVRGDIKAVHRCATPIDTLRGMTALHPTTNTIIDGRYELLERIARGSMGTVYRARQLNLQRTVAVKVLDIDPGLVGATDRQEHHRRFLNEAATLSRLNHPNTVRVFDFGISNDKPYLVMEFVNGMSLHRLLKEEGISPLRAVRIARQICQSLSEAHERGLVHRDLKPANLLITRASDHDMVKVVDFGLVKEIGDAVTMTGDGVLLGTPLYMSPEQIRGHSVDQRCDIYAIGVLLYQCITGRPPFQEKQTAALLMAHLNSDPMSFELARPDLDLPECIEWTVMRCLEKDRDERIYSVLELERALKVCEAALLKPELADTMSLTLRGGHMTVRTGPRPTKRMGQTLGVLFGASLLALLFGYVLARGVRSIQVDEAEPPAVPAAGMFTVEEVAPLPPPAAPPAPSEEVQELEEAAPPAPVPVAPSPAPTRPRAAPRTAPRPAPASPPKPQAPTPATPPAPAKTESLKVKSSDLRNPFATTP